MAPFPTDVTIVGTVLALAVAILVLAGLALYVAFRVRETLHDEKGGGARAAKVAFLIGLLFLSGGVFYYFASGFSAPGQGTTTVPGSSTTSVVASTTSTSATGTSSTVVTTSTITSSTTATTFSTTKTTTAQSVAMPAPSCQGSRVTAGSTFTCDIYVYDQGSSTFSSASIVSSGDFAKFTFLSCAKSVNGGPSTQVSTSSSAISVGDIAPGTTILTVTVQAPSQSGQYSNSVLTLNAPGFPQPVSVTFTMQVTA